MGKKFHLNGYRYSRPNTNRNKEGNIVLISAFSVGPPEVHQWGLNAYGQPYRLDDYIDEDSRSENIISRSELVGGFRGLSAAVSRRGILTGQQLIKMRFSG